MELIDKTLVEYINDVDSPLPSPGGGSVAALVGALGVSLGRMAAHLSVEKKKFKESTTRKKNRFILGFKELVFFKDELIHGVDADALSYNAVIEAYKQKDKEAIQNALTTSAFVALEMQEHSYKALQNIYLLIELANKNLLSDLMAGAILVESCCEIASFNVKANANLLDDLDRKEKYLSDSAMYVKESLKLKNKIINTINKL